MPRLTTFDGMAPKTDGQDLPPNAALEAENCDLYGDRIDPMPALGDVGPVVGLDGAVLAGAVGTLHRAGSVWVGFPEFTHVAPDPSERAGEDSFLFVQDGRLWRSSGQWIADGDGPVPVGIARPCGAPTALTMTGEGTALVFPPLNCAAAPDPNDIECNPDADAPEARSYLVTHVTACHEESAPSDPSNVVDVRNGDAVALLDNSTPPAHAVARRWYRAVATSEGLGVWLFVAEVPIGQAGFVDDVPALALGEVLVTEDHYPPPDCLDGVAVLGNQMSVVWSGDQFWLSEPRLPHAYPPLWRKRVRFPVLSILGATAQIEGAETYLGYVVTTGTPYFLSGAVPEEVTPREYSVWEPGASRHCAAGMEGGIIYASTQGLIALSGSNVASVLNTESTDIEWQQFDPAGLRLAYWGGRVWGFAPRRAFVLPLSNYRQDRGRYLALLTPRADAVFAGPDAPLTLAVAGENGVRLQQWGAGTGVLRSRWLSRVFTMPGQWWPGAAKVVADWPREHPELERARTLLEHWRAQHGCMVDEVFFETNPALRRHEPALLAPRPFATFALLADGREYFRRQVWSSAPFRVPARRGVDWQFEVGGTVRVKEVHFDVSMQDLTQLGLGVSNSV